MSAEALAVYLFRAKFFVKVCKAQVLGDGSTWFDNVERCLAKLSIRGGPVVTLHYAVGASGPKIALYMKTPEQTGPGWTIFSFAYDVFTADVAALQDLYDKIKASEGPASFRHKLPTNILSIDLSL